jgi:hypothetical protein
MASSLNFPMALIIANAKSTSYIYFSKKLSHGHLWPFINFLQTMLGPIKFNHVHNIIPCYICNVLYCRNPTLAKCGGEAQHSQSWGLGVLRDSRMFRVRQQGPKNLALSIWTSVTQVMGKRRAGSQTSSLTPDH